MRKISIEHAACCRLVAPWLASLILLVVSSQVSAESLRIAYTSIAVVYGPLWLTQEAGLFKKYNIEPEFVYIAGGPPSLQALIAGDVAISFTAGGATVAANLQVPTRSCSAPALTRCHSSFGRFPASKTYIN